MNIFEETLVIVVESANVAGVYSVNNKAGYVTIDKSDIGLSNVENISIIGVSGYLQDQIDSNTIVGDFVYLTGNQTISGLKTFIERPQVNGTGVLLSGEAAGSANFQYLPVTGNINLLSNNRYSFNTFNKNITGTLPLNPEQGDEIELYDSAGTWSLNPLIINNNGNYIEQNKDMLQCNVNNGLIKLIYTTDNNIGWRIFPMPIHSVSSILSPSISIEGGPTNGFTPLTINLTGVNLIGAEAPVDEWYWDLNTGDQNFINGQTINYTYNETGLYNITLSGSNSVGFDIENILINVIEPSLSLWDSILDSTYGSNIVAAYDFRDYNASIVTAKIGPNLETSNVTANTDGLDFIKNNTSWAFANSTVACTYPFTMVYVARTNNTLGSPSENVLINCSTSRFGSNVLVFTRTSQSLMPYNGQDNQFTNYLPNGSEWYFYAVSFLNNGTCRYATRKLSSNLNGTVSANNGTSFNGYPGVAAGFGAQSVYGTSGTYRLALFINQAFSTQASMDYLFETVFNNGPASDLALQ